MASQPEFLYLLCFGAALVATSLIFLSSDEGQGFSDKRLSRMCSAFPWFFVIGYLVMYSALFSKLWRLSKLLSMRRQAVGVQQVLLPFCFIMAASVIVLILSCGRLSTLSHGYVLRSMTIRWRLLVNAKVEIEQTTESFPTLSLLGFSSLSLPR
jgi:hypothetical protein